VVSFFAVTGHTSTRGRAVTELRVCCHGALRCVGSRELDLCNNYIVKLHTVYSVQWWRSGSDLQSVGRRFESRYNTINTIKKTCIAHTVTVSRALRRRELISIWLTVQEGLRVISIRVKTYIPLGSTWLQCQVLLYKLQRTLCV